MGGAEDEEGRVMGISHICGPFRPALERMGRVAYEAYEDSIGLRRLLRWEELSQDRRNAWIDAAGAVLGEDQMARDRAPTP